MRVFGQTKGGQAVHAVDLQHGGLSVTVLSFGAILQNVHLDGIEQSLTQGRDSIADYEGAFAYFGAIVGPVANRLKDARAKIGGQPFQFEANENQRTTLHSGASGLHHKVWQIDEASASSVIMSCILPDGDGGFPGNRKITATFRLCDPATLRLTIRAETDATTLMNCANHSYWNLDGTDTIAGHQLRIASPSYLPVDAQNIPTGEIAPVDGTGFDFRAGRPFVPGHPPIDHNFCLSDTQQDLRDVLWLRGASGVTMTMATTEPGLQVYDQRHLGYQALALEAQGWPDAPHQPAFPQFEIGPDKAYSQVTEWRFTTD